MMGCGIAHFDQREPPKLTKFGLKLCSLGFGLAAQLGVWTQGASIAVTAVLKLNGGSSGVGGAR